MTNCLYWAVANLPVVHNYMPSAYIITAEGYRYEDDVKFKCLIHAAIVCHTNYQSDTFYLDYNGLHSTSIINTWIDDWCQERTKEGCKRWNYSTHTYSIRDIKTKRFWKKMAVLGSPYDEVILQQERYKIFKECYE